MEDIGDQGTRYQGLGAAAAPGFDLRPPRRPSPVGDGYNPKVPKSEVAQYAVQYLDEPVIVERSREALRPFLRSRPRVRMAVHARRLASLRDADVLLASYPRSGNTWTRFLVGTGSRVPPGIA